MELVKITRTKKVKSAPRRGRPTLYPGKDISRHGTAYLTNDGWKKMEKVQKELLRRHPELTAVSVSDAFEAGIHRLHTELTRSR